MAVRYTHLGCKVDTTCIIQPNGSWRKHIVLSTEPRLSLVDENAGQVVGAAPKQPPRYRR